MVQRLHAHLQIKFSTDQQPVGYLSKPSNTLYHLDSVLTGCKTSAMGDSVLGSYDASTSQPLQHVALSIDEVSIKERFKLLCKPTYKIRRVKTKGAYLVLAWNFLVTSVFWFIISLSLDSAEEPLQKIIIGAVLLVVTLPLVGWLADSCIGRYKVIYCSSLILWVALVLDTINTIIQELLDGYEHINTVVVQVLFSLTSIGLGGFLSSIMSFGLDQLFDASTNEITAFIMWHIWTSSAPIFIVNLTSYYRVQNYHPYVLFGHLLSCANLTFILVTMFCCNNWLIKEPISQNPFKLIYKVSRYAIKNKYPKNRSAFTYCEDEVISRIDYGKRKYGGPFMIEQVENVKTFYKVLPMVIVGGMTAGEAFIAYLLGIYLKFQFVLPNHSKETQRTMDMVISNTIPYCISVLIVLNEVFVYPIFNRCCLCLTSLHKFLIGEVILVATFLALLIFETLSRQAYLELDGNNTTVSCVLYVEQTLAQTFIYKWIVIPDIFFVLSITLMIIGGLEFISAQVPYSMRGVIHGIAICSVIATPVLNIAIIIPFRQKESIWGTGVISCGFWYALMHIVLCTIGCIMNVIIKVRYKQRKREDVLPNEHIYAERYYSK